MTRAGPSALRPRAAATHMRGSARVGAGTLGLVHRSRTRRRAQGVACASLTMLDGSGRFGSAAIAVTPQRTVGLVVIATPRDPAQHESKLSPTIDQVDPAYEVLARQRLATRVQCRTSIPELGKDAYHGLAGELVTEIAPLTEASDAAMLLTLLTTFSAMAGRSCYVKVGPQCHHPRLFAAIVGRTAHDRKGTAAAAVRPILDAADSDSPSFMGKRQLRGLQSAEALIAAAAADESDQRLLVVEEEYSRLLTVAARQGSTLSPILRSAWDGEELAIVTKLNSLTAKNAHVGVIAHITQDELLARLNSTDVANGYANRFIHVLSRRTRILPEPGELSADRIEHYGRRLRQAIEFAHAPREITRSADFKVEWNRLYHIVERQPSGGSVFDSLIARASPQQLRLALVYALLDQSPTLEVEHLRAAAALWDYSEKTVAFIWGASLGNPKLDTLLTHVAAAGEAGLTRTQITALFSHNLTKDTLDTLVTALVDRGLARVELQATTGRSRHVLIATL